MSELKLGEYKERSYGQVAKGAVEYGNCAVQICVRTPAKDTPRSGLTYILPPGWTEQKNMLAPVAKEAVRLGHTAVTLAFANRWDVSGVLTKNADDIAAVLDALPEEDARAIIGHSGAGSASIRALTKAGGNVLSLTTVAPAEHLAARHRTFRQTVGHLYGAAYEPAAPAGEWRLGLKLRYGTTQHIWQRPLAVGAEAVALLRGSVHDELETLADSPNRPYLRMALGDNDKLFPHNKIPQATRDLYDDWFLYEGAHCTFLNDKGALGAMILRMDAEQFGIALPAEYTKDQLALAA